MGTKKQIGKYTIWILLLLLTIVGGYFIYGLLLRRPAFSDEYMATIRVFTYIAWFITGIVAIVEIISMFIDRDANAWTTVLAACILLVLSTSQDAVFIYWGKHFPAEWINQLFSSLCFMFVAAGVGAACLFLIHEFSIPYSKRERIVSIIVLASCSVMHGLLSMLNMEIVGVFGLILFVGYFAVKLLMHLHYRKAITYPASAAFFSASVSIGIVLAYALATRSHKAFSCYGLASFSTLLTSFLFLSVYIQFIYRTTRKAYKSERLENTLKDLQSSVLKDQIAPHFLFNSLQAVKTNYRLSQDKGDLAIDLLSKHLRNYVESGNKFTVPFTKELDSVMTFVDLANIRTEHPFNVIYDIDVEDFLVPTLAVESLIENAILYSGVNDKEGGYIEISSFEEDDSIIIRITDNGKGFDVNAIREGAVGIKNAFERFRLLLNAECSIDSVIGMGTTIIVTIPKRGNTNEGHRS